MPEYESLETIAKEMTLRTWENTKKPGDPTPEEVGKTIGKLYKVILKSVREAYDRNYE